MGKHHLIKAALRSDVQPAVRKYRHNLSWWQRRKFGLVAGEQDPLAFLHTEAVRHMSVAALTASFRITVSSELAAPALQRGEPHTPSQCQLTGACTICDALIEDLQGLPAIVGRR
jgi:hypothetical protein